jgi:DNA-binding SARP family transcriptional activator
MAVHKLLLLGPVRLETTEGEGAAAGIGPKGYALLAYLAAQPDGRAERGRLAALLWDRDQAQARHALRQMLLVLRRRLGNCVIQNVGGAVALNLNAIDIDLRRFEAGVRSSDDATLAPTCSLWRGQFCDGLDVDAEEFEEWLGIERARLDDRAAEAFRRLMQYQTESGALEAAIESAQRLVRLSPYDDNAHAMLIGLYRRRGRAGLARAAYRHCVELFRRELGTRPTGDIDAALRIPIELGQIRPTPDIPLPSACDAAGARALLQYPSRQRAGDRAWTIRRLAFLGAVIAVAIVVAGERSVIEQFFGSSVPAPRGLAQVEPQVPDGRVSVGAAPAVPAVSNDRLNKSRGSVSTMSDEITRALGLDPKYAHIYPAGC